MTAPSSREEAPTVTVDSAREILKGLDPQLVHDLATFHGQELDDIAVSVQLMQYGDRAVLAAYGALTKAHRPTALPLLEDLINAAFELIINIARKEDIIRALRS